MITQALQAIAAGRLPTWVVRQVERKFARLPLKPRTAAAIAPNPGEQVLADGATVAVIGGGISGSAFARRLLMLAAQEGRRLKVNVLSGPTCNYCGGLVTDLSLVTMRQLYGLDVPPGVKLTELNECIFVNRYGGTVVKIDVPLMSMLRTGKFGIPGLDDAFREQILTGLPDSMHQQLTLMQPSTVVQVSLPSLEPRRPARIQYREQGEVHEFEADYLAIATGLRSLTSPMMKRFLAESGYRPPPMMPASVTEVDTSSALYSRLDHRMLIVGGVVPNSVVALISKSPHWVTMTALQKALTIREIQQVFDHPAVREYIHLPAVEPALRCHTVCAAQVFTRPARNFYGDGWVVLGDLTGYGRVLKDGYFAAMLQADLAADTILHRGLSRRAMDRHFLPPLRQFKVDNLVGMGLFQLNDLLTSRDWFSRLFMRAAQSERAADPYGGYLHAGVRAITTAELSYKFVGALFVAGLLDYYLVRPRQLVKSLFGGPRHRVIAPGAAN